MPKMANFRLADLSMNFRLQEVLENAGLVNGKYTVLDAYPTNLDKITQIPVVTVQSSVADSHAVQLGSRGALNITWELDVFAKGDGQRDDIAYWIWDDFNESSIILYDFNTGFPSTVGDYTGISTLGKIHFGRGSITVIPPDPFSKTIADKHHALILITGYLST